MFVERLGVRCVVHSCRPVTLGPVYSRICAGAPVLSEARMASKAPIRLSIWSGETRKGPRPSTASAKDSDQHFQRIDVLVGRESAAGSPIMPTVSMSSSRASAMPLEPNMCTRQNVRRGAHRRHRAGRAGRKLRQHREHVARVGRRLLLVKLGVDAWIGPPRLISASSTCKPAPVSPPPGDSRGSSRQPPPTTWVECSLEKCASMWRISPSGRSSTSFLNSRIEAKQRLLLPLPSTTPASRQASTARCASARVSASGFSHHTALPVWRPRAPARHAANAAWRGTPPAPRDGDGLVEFGREPEVVRAAKARTSSGSLLTPCTKRSFGSCPAPP